MNYISTSGDLSFKNVSYVFIKIVQQGATI